jgi:hypothetical protein
MRDNPPLAWKLFRQMIEQVERFHGCCCPPRWKRESVPTLPDIRYISLLLYAERAGLASGSMLSKCFIRNLENRGWSFHHTRGGQDIAVPGLLAKCFKPRQVQTIPRRPREHRRRRASWLSPYDREPCSAPPSRARRNALRRTPGLQLV